MLKLITISLFALGLLSLAGCSSFSSGDASVSGTVTYQQRIALPADAVLTVRIEDISRADAASEAVGEQVIDTKGAQVPIPFEVAFDPNRIQDNYRYSLRAYIKDGNGKFLFTSDTGVLVITKGNPTQNVEVNLIPVSN
jgi:putative lipoprotein